VLPPAPVRRRGSAGSAGRAGVGLSETGLLVGRLIGPIDLSRAAEHTASVVGRRVPGLSQSPRVWWHCPVGGCKERKQAASPPLCKIHKTLMISG